MEKQISIYQYVALAIDFEGCINIQKRQRDKINIFIKIEVYNTSKELLEEFKNIVGFGKVSKERILKDGRRNQYHWTISIKEIREHFSLIQPYLILKWRQGELALEALKIIKEYSYCLSLSYHDRKEMYTDEEQYLFESIYQECLILNARGKI